MRCRIRAVADELSLIGCSEWAVIESNTSVTLPCSALVALLLNKTFPALSSLRASESIAKLLTYWIASPQLTSLPLGEAELPFSNQFKRTTRQKLYGLPQFRLASHRLHRLGKKVSRRGWRSKTTDKKGLPGSRISAVGFDQRVFSLLCSQTSLCLSGSSTSNSVCASFQYGKIRQLRFPTFTFSDSKCLIL